MSDPNPIPPGWQPLVDDLILAILRDYEDVIVIDIDASRGWLTVTCDDRLLDPGQRYRLSRMVQGYVTQSLSTCMCCGSGHGRDRGERNVVTCDDCDQETWCDA